MKIAQLLSGFGVVLNNEEKKFVEAHNQVKITALQEHDFWVAQNLVRKGVYSISKDNVTLIKNLHETDT